MDLDPLWYKKALIYELHIRAFSESNGDGHGDIPGLISNLSFAINTNQHGRTFQDRSYVLLINKRPSNIKSWVKIHNIGVRGKRGNIVQVYPAVEYDFSPE